ncbi:hypothetical protein F5884DRAFT_853182 [Xylogone sp. PMI_703]|nr:hypothetical protein F5884DRAFT_853182 [Xylogone sp. PMI_703]
MADKTTFTSNPLPSSAFDSGRSTAMQAHATQLPSSPLRLLHPSSTSSSSNIAPKPAHIMSSISQKHDTMRSDKPFSLANLMSPPEPPRKESFYEAPAPIMATPSRPLYPLSNGAFMPSPPVSPDQKPDTTEAPLPSIVTDPILYPPTTQDAHSVSSTQPPLFVDDEVLAAQRAVDEHLAARRESSIFREASPPRRSEYELALEFKSIVARSFNANRKRWFQRERAYLMEDRALQSGGRRYSPIAPATAKAPRAPTSRIPAKVEKKQPRERPQPRPQFTRATPDPAKRVAREDKDFDALPDYCPPLSSLPNKPNSLKVDWKGAPIDLRYDPHAHLLHPDEILLAANLRLDCATYLTSKRRIFIKRIEALRIGKEFRKTDAQQACKIDVNKASKLWQAFEKVGWLNPTWVRQFV